PPDPRDREIQRRKPRRWLHRRRRHRHCRRRHRAQFRPTAVAASIACSIAGGDAAQARQLREPCPLDAATHAIEGLGKRTPRQIFRYIPRFECELTINTASFRDYCCIIYRWRYLVYAGLAADTNPAHIDSHQGEGEMKLAPSLRSARPGLSS